MLCLDRLCAIEQGIRDELVVEYDGGILDVAIEQPVVHIVIGADFQGFL